MPDPTLIGLVVAPVLAIGLLIGSERRRRRALDRLFDEVAERSKDREGKA